MDQEQYQEIEQALQEGRLSEALSLLATAVKDREKSIRDDVGLLRSKFEYYRNQYEVKGVLTNQEFNIHYSKTMLGAQDVLERLRGGHSQVGVDRRSFVWPLLLVVLLGIGGTAWYFMSTPEEAKEASSELQPLSRTAVDSVNTPADHSDDEPEPAPLASNQPPPSTPQKQIEKEEKTVPATIEVTEVEEEEPPPPARTFSVNIIRNSKMSGADILVDGQPALVLKATASIVTIRVSEKQTMHVFELRKDGDTCRREQLITEDNQRITFNCT